MPIILCRVRRLASWIEGCSTGERACRAIEGWADWCFCVKRLTAKYPYLWTDSGTAWAGSCDYPVVARAWLGVVYRQYIPDLANLNDPSQWPDDIESLDALKARAKEFLAWVGQEYAGKRVVAVGHGIINKAIQSVYYDKPMNELRPMGNAEVRRLAL